MTMGWNWDSGAQLAVAMISPMGSLERLPGLLAAADFDGVEASTYTPLRKSAPIRDLGARSDAAASTAFGATNRSGPFSG